MFAGEDATGAGDVEGATGGDVEAVPLELGVVEEGDLGVTTGRGAGEVGRRNIGALRPCHRAKAKEREQFLHVCVIAECVMECQDIFRLLQVRKKFAERRGRRRIMKIGSIIALLFLSAGLASAGTSVSAYLKKDDEWFGGKEAREVLENILSYQAASGAWPKNTDTSGKRYKGKKEDIRGTFDNGATVDELRFLARYFELENEVRALMSLSNGLNCLLKAQYENGGWPQSYPAGKGYGRHITFNDGAMVRIMEFLREVANSPAFKVVSTGQRKASAEAFERGVECILKCQIRVGGTLTAWCAQHDEIDFKPRPARSYELVSLSGSESVGIIRLLMSLDNPSPEVRKAVEGAVAWFDSARLKGMRVEKVKDKKGPSGINRVVIADAKAPDLWARFYHVETNKPIFCDRDGIPKGSLKEIGYERRNGYSWLGNWPAKLLEREYPAWKEKVLVTKD